MSACHHRLAELCPSQREDFIVLGKIKKDPWRRSPGTQFESKPRDHPRAHAPSESLLWTTMSCSA
jgi:hypothetical protein